MYYTKKLSGSKEFNCLVEEAKEEIIGCLDWYRSYGCDFHNEVFNREMKFYNDIEAEDFLNAIGVFDAIRVIKEYEKDNYGTIYTDLSNPVEIANMIWYIVGEEIIEDMFGRSDVWDDVWNDIITDEASDVLIEIAKNYIIKI